MAPTFLWLWVSRELRGMTGLFGNWDYLQRPNVGLSIRSSCLPMTRVTQKPLPCPNLLWVATGRCAPRAHVANLLIGLDCPVGQLLVKVHGSFGEPCNCSVRPGQRHSHMNTGSCALCYSCHDYLVPSTCWKFFGDG